MAADTEPLEILLHLPLLCEDKVSHFFCTPVSLLPLLLFFTTFPLGSLPKCLILAIPIHAHQRPVDQSYPPAHAYPPTLLLTLTLSSSLTITLPMPSHIPTSTSLTHKLHRPNLLIERTIRIRALASSPRPCVRRVTPCHCMRHPRERRLAAQDSSPEPQGRH